MNMGDLWLVPSFQLLRVVRVYCELKVLTTIQSLIRYIDAGIETNAEVGDSILSPSLFL